jgi:translation initiation factor 1
MSSKRPPPPASGGKPGQPASGDATSSPFAALAGLRDALPPGTPPPAAPPPDTAKPAKPGPARAVVRLERKGRSGKEATIIDKLGLAPAELERWTRELKQSLGTGGAVEGEMIVLQGDVRSRLEPVLLARGVRKVTMG